MGLTPGTVLSKDSNFLAWLQGERHSKSADIDAEGALKPETKVTFENQLGLHGPNALLAHDIRPYR
jgi:hypothetical protein